MHEQLTASVFSATVQIVPESTHATDGFFSISLAYLHVPPKYAHHVERAAIRSHRSRRASDGGHARVRLEGIGVPGSEQEERRHDGGPWYPRHRIVRVFL